MNAVLPFASTNTVDGIVGRRLDALARCPRPGPRRTGTATGYSPEEASRAGWRLSLRVEAEERDLACRARRPRAGRRELGAARAAPRRPLVDDDRWPRSSSRRALERVAAAAEQLAGLVVQRGERRRRALERARRARGRSVGGGAGAPLGSSPPPACVRPMTRRRSAPTSEASASRRARTAQGSQIRRVRSPASASMEVDSREVRGTEMPLADRPPDPARESAEPRDAARGSLYVTIERAVLAESTQWPPRPRPSHRPSDARARRAAFTREPFVLEGEDAAVALAPGTRPPPRARRRAGRARRRRRVPVDRVAPALVAAARARPPAQRGRAARSPTARCSPRTRSTRCPAR